MICHSSCIEQAQGLDEFCEPSEHEAGENFLRKVIAKASA
jgi:hypothetical protein